jgi:predicted Zn-dependent peptidase
MKVDKPEITPVEVNREGISDFAGAFLAKETPDIEPRFIDFSRVFQKSALSEHVGLRVVNDRHSKVFRLHYCFDMGKTAERRLALAASYLSYLGTSRFSPGQVQQEFYRLGLSFSASCQDDCFFLTLEGLSESFDQGVSLLGHLISDARPNAEALANLVADILLRRENEKSDKRVILSKAMASYAKYGPRSPFSDRIPAARLAEIKPEELTDMIRGLFAYKHDVLYCGPGTARSVGAVIKKYHPKDAGTLALLKAEKYPEKGVKKDRVLFVHFPMIQAELLLLSKGTPGFNLEEYVFNEWYNQYFGYGLSSIVFQEIRESKALAYSAYAHAGSPTRKNRAHWLQAYVGTQPDKLREAIEAFQSIMENMPVSLAQMETARQSVMKQIAASRIIRSDIFWTWRGNRDRGFRNRDLRRDIYEAMMNATPEDLIRFHDERVKGRKYTWLVLGDRNNLDFEYLGKIGKVTELKPEEIFGE